MKKLMLIFIVLFVVLASGILFLQTNKVSGNSLSNDGYTYTINFDREIKNNPQNGKNYLVNDKKALSVIIAKSSDSTDCGARGAKVADKVSIMGKQYSLCRLSNSNPESSLYTANFQTNNTWHTVIIFSTNNAPVDIEDAKSIVSSVELSK
jgi:hypothetical protein